MTELNLNVFNIIIISGVLHGIIFSITVTSQKKFITNNTIYLALVVLFLSLSNFQYWILDTGLIENYPVLKYIYFPWHWLVLPMFYLYVKRFISTSEIPVRLKYILILPFFVVLLIHIFQVVYKLVFDNSYEIPSHFGRGIFVYIEFFSVTFNVLLMYLTYKMIVNYESDTRFNYEIVKSETGWLKKLIYLGLLTCLFWLVAILLVVVYDLNKSYVFYPMWIGVSILVYWIGYVGINKSKLLKERIQIRAISKKDKIHKKSESYTNFENLIVSEELYLNPDLNLQEVADKLNISKGYLSQLISKESTLNFNDYINSLRIVASKEMLLNKDYDNYTIMAIGLESGFKSKSSFFTAFKKFTNTSPSNYKKEVRYN